MVIAIIILSIVAVLSILLNVVLIAYMKFLFNKVKEIMKVSKQLMATFDNSIEITDDECENIYRDVNLIVSTQKANETAIAYDISSYEKNNIIGLTYFVQEQDLNELQKSFIQQIPGADELSPQEQKELFTKPEIIPGCTVYQLKDGSWIWRSSLLSFGQ